MITINSDSLTQLERNALEFHLSANATAGGQIAPTLDQFVQERVDQLVAGLVETYVQVNLPQLAGIGRKLLSITEEKREDLIAQLEAEAEGSGSQAEQPGAIKSQHDGAVKSQE